MNSRRGFTLIELLVSMVIIAILASIVTIAIFKSREKAFNTRIKTDVSKLSQAMSSYLISSSSPAPATKLVSSVYPKGVDDQVPSNILKEDSVTPYGTSLKEIFTKYLAIPIRAGLDSQNCLRSSSISKVGYCYLRYPPNQNISNNWAIYAGLEYPENTTELFYGSVNGQLKLLILDPSTTNSPIIKD